jgi:hypothetical protein
MHIAQRHRRPIKSSYIVILISLICIRFCRSAFASGEPDAFAINGVGARQGGMGGAFIGLSDDIESVYYNPAGLGNLKTAGFTSMYQTPSLETSRGFLAFNKNWDDPVLPGSVAVGWLRMQSKDIELTNTDEQVLGNDTLANDLVLIGAGVHPFEHIALGATVKYFRFAFDGFKESGFGIDLGAHGDYGVFRFGAALTDLDGTTLHGNSITAGSPDASDKVPMRLRPGVAVVLPHPFGFPLDLDADADEIIKLEGPQETRLFLGLELWGFEKHVALRGGYQEQSGPTVGAGIMLSGWQLDYSYLISLHLMDESRLGLSYHFQ